MNGRTTGRAPSRLLFVDASRGASGDMILGALVDLGLPIEVLRAALEPLPLEGFTIASRKVKSCALAGTKVDVVVQAESPARTWREIESIIDQPGLAPRVRERALGIFRRLIEAEAEVHGTTFERAHLHEAGATDAIVDIVGACVGIEHLEVDEIVVSEMTTGFGEVRCSHGSYPVPAPATLLLLAGVPVCAGEIEAERLTPTGAAVLTTLADRWARMPPMRPDSVGYGAGSRDLGQTPNLLRMVVGQTGSRAEFEGLRGEIALIECTMDDATPQALAFAARRLLDAGAVDVHTTPVTMKKGRPGHHLTVLARPDDLSRMARLVLTETTTLGLRFRLEQRLELEREIRPVETRFGPVEVKIGTLNGEVLRVWPEYDSCAALAERHAVPLWEVQQAALEGYAAACRTREQDGSEEERP